MSSFPKKGGKLPCRAARCPLGAGVERHVWPAGNEDKIVTKISSDASFGPKGLGFGNTFWTTIVSWLARNGIQEQTVSNPDETSIENCVKGWGKGPYSSRVFNVESEVDEEQLDRLMSHLKGIIAELEVPDQRITNDVLAAFVSTQDPPPEALLDLERHARGQELSPIGSERASTATSSGKHSSPCADRSTATASSM
jgi:hypothetical protein